MPTVIADKDLRRFFECQLEKFDGDFEPNTDYIQTLLQQVPIHILPTWYALPKNTDDIFASIIEKHLATPKIYQRYIGELTFDNPKQQEIMRLVLESKELSLAASFLKKKCSLSDEEFIENMLFLEYSLACFSIYAETETGFEERIVPLHEWKAWLQFHVQTECKSQKSTQVQRQHPQDFGYIEEMSAIMKGGKNTHIPFEMVVERVNALSFMSEGGITTTGREWLSKLPQEQSMILYLHAMNRMRVNAHPFTDKDVREIEKSLKRVLKSGWVLFDDFLKGVYANIGGAHPIILKKQGKRWRFALPTYSDAEKTFIYNTVMKFLFESGITAIGECDGKACFTLTPFGQITIGN